MRWRTILVVAAAVAILVGGYDLVAGRLTCTEENSGCAFGQSKDGFYTGVVTGPAGGLAAGQMVMVEFGSRRGLPPVAVHSDASGGLCLIWPAERLAPEGLRWHPLALERPPVGCQTSSAGVPWNRADGLRGRWQFISVLVLVALSLSAVFGAMLAKRRRPFEVIAIVSSLAALVVCVAVWA